MPTQHGESVVIRVLPRDRGLLDLGRIGLIGREAFWVDGAGAIFFQLRYGKQPLELEKGKSTLKASTFDDLVEQLDQIKTIAVAGGLDDALAACALLYFFAPLR